MGLLTLNELSGLGQNGTFFAPAALAPVPGGGPTRQATSYRAPAPAPVYGPPAVSVPAGWAAPPPRPVTTAPPRRPLTPGPATRPRPQVFLSTSLLAQNKARRARAAAASARLAAANRARAAESARLARLGTSRRAWARERSRQLQVMRLRRALAEASRRGYFTMDPPPGLFGKYRAAWESAKGAAGARESRAHLAAKARREALAARRAAKFQSALRGDLGAAAQAAAHRLANQPRGMPMVEFEMRTRHGIWPGRPSTPGRAPAVAGEGSVGLSVPRSNLLSDLFRAL